MDADLTFEEIPPPPPPERSKRRKNPGWRPKLNYTQNLIFEDPSLYVLAYGPKGSGKSVGCVHSLIRHCYDERNALAFVLAPAIRTGAEGTMKDLEWALDIWQNGNWKDREETERSDEGIGINYTVASLDSNTKDRILFISNRHGGWSKVILLSIPYSEVVEKRMKDLSPSFVLVSEITELENSKYFTYVSQQLGRRRGIVGPQQYVANCNPEGPSHWVYKVFWVDNILEDGTTDPDYAVYFVPVEENRPNLPPGYIERLIKLYKDPIDHRRLIGGEWIDRPSGEAIFKDYFIPEIMVRGEFLKGTGLVPIKGFPIITGWDPGPRNYSVHFHQLVSVTNKGMLWRTFDEMNYVGSFQPDFIVIPKVLKRMDFWQTYLGSQAAFMHIADQSAFTHKRHDGTYDATRVWQLSGKRIKLRDCPSGADSVVARVNMVRSMFMEELLYISAQCEKTLDMLRLLVSEKPKDGKHDAFEGLRPQRSPYLHSFDSYSYPMYYYVMKPASVALHTAVVPKDTGSPGVFRVGRG